MDWGQKGIGRKKGRILIFLVSVLCCHCDNIDIFITQKYQNEALVLYIKKACHPGDCLPRSCSDSAAVCSRESYKVISKDVYCRAKEPFE